MTVYPTATHGIISRMTGSFFSYHGWPTVCRSDDGTLYAVCSGFRLQHVCPFGKTVMFVSFDEGKTWTPPIVVNDTYLDDRDAGIVSLGGGKLLLTWFCHPAETYLNEYYQSIKNSTSKREAILTLGMLAAFEGLSDKEKQGGSFIRLSHDRGVTWSAQIKVPVSSPHGPALLPDGRLLYLGKELYSDLPAEDRHAILAFESRDDGKTWQKLAKIPLPEGTVPDNFHEPHAIALPDGTLLGAIRAQGAGVDYGFTIYTCRSTDGGRTWSVPAPTGICGSPPHLLLHSSGALICTYGRRTPPFGERAAISYNNGITWEDEYVIYDGAPDADLGYPSTVELSDGSLLTVYYQKYPGDGKCSLLMTRWRLEK
ncbi:MAG TPA: sialidase family protein [Bacillota bacterium]|nr:exo-alpha-sialidase [Clostridiales bacterium]HPT84438.1 sialidase family protein [Bacillota bacterium]